MFFTKNDVALLGSEYIANGLADGSIFYVGDDTYISAENLERAMNTLKIVLVRDVNDTKKYLKRDIALAQKEKGDLMIVQGVFVTAAYFQDAVANYKILRCETCGEFLFADTAIHTESGKTLCRRCAERSYAQCEDCGKWYPKSLVVTVGGHKKCLSCLSSVAFQCPHCGQWHMNTEATHEVFVNGNSEIWCDSCFTEHAATCSDCGRSVPRSEIHSDGRCNSCYQNYYRDAIMSYGYRPTPRFFGSGQEGDNGLFYGVELETDTRDSSGRNQEFARKLRSVSEVYCKHDGSLINGAEVVTHPCTLNYHLNGGFWEKVNAAAIETEMRSHDINTCGLHIHISRLPFINHGVENYDAKIALAFEKFWADWITFSRRKGGTVERWAARYGVTTIEGLRPELDRCVRIGHGARYHSVNVTNANTVEIRIFRGTLKVDSIKATIWAVANISERILAGWTPESAESFRDLFDMENAPEFFTQYLESRGL